MSCLFSGPIRNSSRRQSSSSLHETFRSNCSQYDLQVMRVNKLESHRFDTSIFKACCFTWTAFHQSRILLPTYSTAGLKRYPEFEFLFWTKIYGCANLQPAVQEHSNLVSRSSFELRYESYTSKNYGCVISMTRHGDNNKKPSTIPVACTCFTVKVK